MSTLTINQPTTIASPAVSARRPLLKSTVLAAVAGSFVAEIVDGIGRAAGVPMKAALLGGSHTSTIGVGGFAIMTLCHLAVGVAIVAVLRRRATPARTFVRWATALAALSVLVPVTAAHTATATKVTLAVAHIVVAAVVIPLLARALPSRA
jgi:hypothetical protein